MMRKILFLSVVAVIFAACQSKSEYTITGEITDPMFDGQKVSFIEWTGNEMATLDSTTVASGKFKIKGSTESPVLRFITIGENENTIQTIVMAEPGKIKVVYDSLFHVTGTPLNNAYTDFNNKQIELSEKVRKLSDEFSKATKEETLTDELRDEIMSNYKKIENESKAIHIDFIKENVNNELGQFLFVNMAGMLDAEQKKEVIAMLDEEHKAKETLKPIVDQLKAEEAVAIGKEYIDFTMESPSGETVSLSDYVGKDKYVFIDFWASWCGPCIQEMPNVVNAYNKYKNKGLEIVGVSLDNDKDKWIQGIKDMKMEWPQMSDLKLWDSKVVGLYAIQGIPHTILLDKEGKIIAKNLRGEKLDEKLAELMN